jgi:hypothetical protein
MNWQAWGRGLVVAVSTAALDAATSSWVDPGILTDPVKLKAMGLKAAFMAIGAMLLYLKTHPLPDVKGQE